MVVGRRFGFRWIQKKRDSRYQILNVDGRRRLW
jgi:hypothetical protein